MSYRGQLQVATHLHKSIYVVVSDTVLHCVGAMACPMLPSTAKRCQELP